jgi:hypothetical protein
LAGRFLTRRGFEGIRRRNPMNNGGGRIFP